MNTRQIQEKHAKKGHNEGVKEIERGWKGGEKEGVGRKIGKECLPTGSFPTGCLVPTGVAE